MSNGLTQNHPLIQTGTAQNLGERLVKKKFPNIPAQIRAALFYFFYLAAIGTTAPFLYVVYRQHGLTPAEIGVVIAVAHVMNFIASPIWGAANDLRQQKGGLHLLPLACLCAGPSILLLQGARGLAPILLAVILWGFFAWSIISLADAATLNMLGNNRHHYGRVRVWGSLGSVCASLAVGLLGTQLGLEIVFPLYVIMLLACAAVSFSFPKVDYEKSPSVNAGISHLFRNPRTVFFFLSIFLLAMGYMGWRGTFSLYLEDMKATTGVIGAFFAIGSALEIPIAASSPWWLKRWGAGASLITSFAFFSFLWIGCSLIGEPTLALPLALVHGFSYGIYDVAGVVYVGQVAPPGFTSLAQGVYGGINRGLGSILGSLVGGFLFQNIGGAVTYRISALFGLLALGCLVRINDHSIKEINYEGRGNQPRFF